MMNATLEPVHGLPASGLMSVRQRIRIVKIQDTKGCRQWHQLYFSSGWSPLPQRPGSPCRQTRSTSCQWTPAPLRSSTSCRSLNSWREPWVGCSPISSSSLTPTSGSGCQEALSHKYALGDAWKGELVVTTSLHVLPHLGFDSVVVNFTILPFTSWHTHIKCRSVGFWMRTLVGLEMGFE